MSSVRSFAFLWRFWSLAAGTSTTVQEKRNIFRSFCTDLRKFLNFQMSEEKKLASEQKLCLWAAVAGHNFFI